MYISLTHNLYTMLSLTSEMLKNSQQHRRVTRHLLNNIAKPSLRAFLYAYLYLVLPKAIGQILSAIRKNKYDKIIPRVKNHDKCLASSKIPNVCC